MSWKEHLRPSLADAAIYDVAPAQGRARLHANECAEPWPAGVTDALADVVRTCEFNRYPDTSGRRLRAVLAEQHGCAPERIVLGNGSDEVIALLQIALGGGRAPAVVFPTPTFVMYGMSARVLGYAQRAVPLDADLQLDDAAMRAALPGAALCFLARPNNPTSSLWDADRIERLVHAFPSTVFVVDEAYAAYSPGASMWGPNRPDNYVHMATLSKVGLAALRVGYAIACPQLAEALNKVRHPYNVSQTSLTLAEAVLTRFGAEQAAMVAAVIANRARLVAIMRSVPDAHVYPAHANMVLARLPSTARARALVEHLAGEGVLIKDATGFAGLEGCVRVSVGTADELDALEQALGAV